MTTPKKFSLHSLRSGRTSSAANIGISDRPLSKQQGRINLFLDAQFFGRTVLLTRPIGLAKSEHVKPTCTLNRETARNISFCSFCGAFSFNVFSSKVFQ